MENLKRSNGTLSREEQIKELEEELDFVKERIRELERKLGY